MTRRQYNPVKTFNYSRELKYGRKGKVNIFEWRGGKVRTLISSDGRQLQVLDKGTSRDLIPDLKKASQLFVRDGKKISASFKSEEPPKEEPKKKTVEPKPAPAAKPAQKKVETEKPKPPPPRSVQPFDVEPMKLTEKDRAKARLVPVPDKGPVPTPYIDWANIPEHCKISSIAHFDYPVPGAPKGLLPALRDMFSLSRRYGDEIPVNVLIQGPKGTGKSQLIKKFADDAGLPYWGVIGQEGIRADELLGHYELKKGTSKWVDGVIPRAVRSGGILHIDEPNVIEPAILMRLDELLDNKRQLNMEDLNGELVKAHPDLFIVFTMNPPTYEGVKPLPDPIVSRLTKRFKLEYPPKKIEYKIIESKLRSIGVKPGEYKSSSTGLPSGKYGEEVVDFMKIIDGLRRDPDLIYTPSIRETIGFVQSLREGFNFHTSFDQNVKNFYWGEDETKVEEALVAVRRR